MILLDILRAVASIKAVKSNFGAMYCSVVEIYIKPKNPCHNEYRFSPKHTRHGL